MSGEHTGVGLEANTSPRIGQQLTMAFILALDIGAAARLATTPPEVLPPAPPAAIVVEPARRDDSTSEPPEPLLPKAQQD